MKNTRKPSLLFGLIITIVFFMGFFLMAGDNPNGYYLLYGGLALGLLYWVWSIIAVAVADDLKKYQKTFWLIIISAVPFFGALLYNILHFRKNRIAA